MVRIDVETPATRDLLQQVVDARGSIVAIATSDPAAIVDGFRHQAVRDGMAVYAWSETGGLRSLRERDVVVEGCGRFADALRYVVNSSHFGVYLMRGWRSPPDAQERTLLRQVAAIRGGHPRRVVLLGSDTELSGLPPISLVRIEQRVPEARRPRLRDGRWVPG